MFARNLKCLECGRTFPLENKSSHPNPYYDFLDVVYDYGKIKEFPATVKNSKIPLERFIPLLPIKGIKTSLCEGNTPILVLQNFCGFEKVYVKDEGCNPTGCFKDRESMLLVNMALEAGIRRVYVASCGNSALSLSAYAKKAGMEATCFIPKNSEKKGLIESYGARVQELGSTYEDVYRKVIEMNPEGLNCTPGSNHFNEEADKTISFEIWENMGVPDRIVIPCGNGTNLAGIWKGFRELKILGKTNKLPEIIGVQVKGAAPIAEAMSKGKYFVRLQDVSESIAESIVATESYTSAKAVKALRESGGRVIEVSDPEIMSALSETRKHRMFPEPASASVFAALKKLDASEDGNTVCIMSGRDKSMIPVKFK